MQTQWRTGAVGSTGLDYAGVRADLDELGIEGEQRREIWLGIKACERAVLDVWEESRQRERDRAARS